MKTPEKYRIKKGLFASTEADGNNGAFLIPYQSFILTVISGVGEGWEHVSVSLPNRTPNWYEMCFIKDLFWDKEETVVQFHPPESQYVNNHENCLHLWKPIGYDIKTPPSILVGFRGE